jgi:SlyX protein
VSADQERIEALETKLTFQEDTIQVLNDALIEQQARIDHLEAMLKLVSERVLTTPEEAQNESAPEPPPPHY